LRGNLELVGLNQSCAAREAGGHLALFQPRGRRDRYGACHGQLLGQRRGQRAAHPFRRLVQRSPSGCQRCPPVATRGHQRCIHHGVRLPAGVRDDQPNAKRSARFPGRLDRRNRQLIPGHVGQRDRQPPCWLRLVKEGRRVGDVEPLAVGLVDQEIVVPADADQTTVGQWAVRLAKVRFGGLGCLSAALRQIDFLVGVQGRHRLGSKVVQPPMLGAQTRRQQHRGLFEHVVSDLQGPRRSFPRLVVDHLRTERNVEELDNSPSAIGRPSLDASSLDFQRRDILRAGRKTHHSQQDGRQNGGCSHFASPRSRAVCSPRHADIVHSAAGQEHRTHRPRSPIPQMPHRADGRRGTTA